MLGEDVGFSFHDESWGDPKLDDSSSKVVPRAESSVAQGSQEEGSENASMLMELWQLTHGRDPPAWADRGFTGIREDIKRRVAEAEGIREELTLYCPSWDLEPCQRPRAHLDPLLPGIKVPVVHPANYAEGHPIPPH